MYLMRGFEIFIIRFLDDNFFMVNINEVFLELYDFFYIFLNFGRESIFINVLCILIFWVVLVM